MTRGKKIEGRLARLIIFGDAQRRFVSEAIEDFSRFVEKKAQIIANCFKGDCPTGVLNEADYAVVFGGDGTILSAARDLSETDVPVIGVNVGKLGFLAEFSVEELKQLFGRIINGEMLIEKRMIIKCCVGNGQKEIFCSTAINDVVITAGPPFSMIDLNIAVRGQSPAGCISDGLIISTPTGSTAYNLSAGGPILSANLSALVITPICPHSLSFRPIVISDASEIEIQPQRINDGTTITLDGQVSSKLNIGDVIKVQRHSGSFAVVNNPMGYTGWQIKLGTKTKI